MAAHPSRCVRRLRARRRAGRADDLRRDAAGLLPAGGPRLDDMDLNWVEASLCFPTFPRFCGQTFLEAQRQGARAAVRAGLQRLDGRGVVRRLRRPAAPAVPHPAVGPAARGAEVRRNAARGVRAVCFSELPPQPRAAVGARRRPALGPVRRRVRRDRHRHLHAQRLGLEDAVDVARRAAGGVVDAHPRARRGVDGRLAVLGPAGALPRPDAHLLRGPDRLDPVHPRAGRPRVGAQPRLERLAAPRARSRRAPTTGAASTAASSTTRPGSPRSTPSAPTR